MVSFADMKRNREKMFQDLNKQVSDSNKRGGKDDRFWYPSVDQSGNGFAIIRFLPAPGEEPAPFVRMWSYGFKDKGGWYIENSRTTLGLDERDPVHESNKALRADGSKTSKAIADRRKASQSYISNIEVIRDPANPENEGKQFLYRYGAKIWGKLQEKMNPSFEGETAMNPFDLWEGANLRLKIKTDGKTAENPKGFRNYDSSEWDQPGPLHKDDDKMEASWKACYSLAAIIAPDQFKSYEDLKARFEKVTGEVSNAEERMPQGSRSQREERSAPEPRQAKTRNAPVEKEKAEDAPPWNEDDAGSGDDEDLKFYEDLLKGDG